MSFNFGAPQKAPATTASTFQFNAGGGDAKLATTSAPSLFGTTPSFGATATTTTLSFGSPATSLSFGLSKPSSVTSVSSGTFTPILAVSSSTTAADTAATAPKLSFGTTPAAAAPAPGAATAAAPAATGSGGLTFNQLEDSINKWTLDLDEQGKHFINQAKTLNAWDNFLISNAEKIINLDENIKKIKQQQGTLDQELDFVLGQQRELEELIAPLEKELNDLSVTDIDRNQMYQMSENIDSQLKQMSDDLKEIIEHINESNKDDENLNPITQISRILNAHMNSLQWLDTNTALVSSHLEDISKAQDFNKRNLSLNHSFKPFP